MELNDAQLAFLCKLRTGSCRAVAALDASVIGPLIRANLVQWDDDPADAAKRRARGGSSFALTSLGERVLADQQVACLQD